MQTSVVTPISWGSGLSSEWWQVAGLLCAWISYFVIHSLLASLHTKAWVVKHWPGAMSWYRIVYNILAIILLIPPVWLNFSDQSPVLLHWHGIWRLLADLLAILAILGFVWTLRYYDTAEFLGLRQHQSRSQDICDQEHFCISPAHRFVRHPWYSFALIIIWTRDMNLSSLISATVITLYFIIGSRLEERKLVDYYGDIYRTYQSRVAGLFPLPWRILDRETAKTLSNPGKPVITTKE